MSIIQVGYRQTNPTEDLPSTILAETILELEMFP
jgi:hypothetical protein